MSLMAPVEPPFSSSVGLQRRRGWSTKEQHEEWIPPPGPSIPSCSTVTLQGPSRGVAQNLQDACKRCDAYLFERLAQAAKALKTGVSDRLITEALSEAHTQVVTVDTELDSSQAPEGEASRRWLQQLQAFLLTLLKDIEEARQRLEKDLPRAEREWHQLLHTASAKLEFGIAVQQEADGHAQDSLDSSCSSSVCGSSCTSSAGTSKSGHRLVAMRGRLGYTQHWAMKIAL